MKTYILTILLCLVGLSTMASGSISEGNYIKASMVLSHNTIGAFVADTLGVDSLSVDSVQADTTKKERTAGIDAPIDFVAKDSMVYDAKLGLAYLFGNAKVNYQNMELTAAKITMNMDSSMVRAEGKTDTAGVMLEKPLFKQGSEQYDSHNMSFNFKTKKGFIQNTYTEQGNGYMQSARSKRTDEGVVYLEHAKYTTCDAEHPHFYLALSRAKVRPGKDVVFGPAHLVVEDVPLPLAIPYGFFPFNKKYSSGFLMPTIGDETIRGFYLRDGGYYFALNDKMDLRLLGEIYTKGSWGVSLETNYRKRYRHNGNFYLSYLNTVEGEKNMPDYMEQTSLKIQWSHSLDSKAIPNTSFSARVNFASQSYERNNLQSRYDPVAYSQSTRASAISYSRTFPKIGLNIALSTNLTQNMRDSSVAVTLPDMSISLNRFYPFKRKHAAGKDKWYEKISMSYTGSLTNSITTTESQLLKSNIIKDWRNGMQHRIPIDATFQLFKYINVTPSFNFRDIMYSRKVNRSWDTEQQREVQDTVYGFYNLYDWSAAISANTTLYGFYKPTLGILKEKVEMVRHMIKPSVSFNYAPDFTTSHYGYNTFYTKTDANGQVSTVAYSPYAGQAYGYPSGRKTGSISMSLSNNVEMKVKSDKDSTGVRKISLIDELSGSLSYNLAAERKPWSDLQMRVRLKLTEKYTFSMSAVFATYAYEFDEKGNVIVGDRTEWSHGRFGRFQGMSQNFSYTFNNQTFQKLWGKIQGKDNEEEQTKNDEDTTEDGYESIEDANIDPDIKENREASKSAKSKSTINDDGYLSFSLPWALTVSYGITMAEDRSKPIHVKNMRYPYKYTQNLNFSGFVRISDGWNISYSSGYDFNFKELSMTTLSLSRDLHCFEMSCNVVLRPYSSFNFCFRARASELADALKWDKRSSYSTNIEWY
ncbi:MAG: LPS-assembly protein LptD [Bacteroidaceae bacterium]|nr:LPS-assembly protein LptD [Bacteroidaceae bacterium]